MEVAMPKKRWGAEQRLEFIEFVSFWEGGINRSNLIEQFGVSAPQASSDLTTYQQIAPKNLRYDLSSKRYVTTDEFECKLIRPDPDRYLKQLTALATHTVERADTWLGNLPAIDVIPIPTRRVDPALLRSILKSIKSNRSIEIEYQSMSTATPDSLWRRITPHAFGSDGLRWHVRAYCHRDSRFKDFLLSRCWGARSEGEPGATAQQDKQWADFFAVELIANPALSPSQKTAIEFDYAMQDGRTVLPVRYALLYYFDKRLRSDIAVKQAYGSLGDPREAPVVVANFDAYVEALISVGVKLKSDLDLAT
jgi:hypothetical protein